MDLDAMLKQAQKLQEDMEAVQKKLESEEVKVSVGGGAVEISITGSTKFKSFKISDELHKGNKEDLEKTVLSALEEAITKSREKHEESMKDITKSLELPDLGEIENLMKDSGPKRRTDASGSSDMITGTSPGFKV